MFKPLYSESKRQQQTLTMTVLVFLLLTSFASQGGQVLAVLNFELNDITSLPNSQQEQQRTATMRPLLEQALMQAYHYNMVNIDTSEQNKLNASMGYLFHYPDQVAKLGRQFGADWLIVAQHSKPSYLFSYLLVHMVDVKTESLIASFAIELKGNHQTVTLRGINRLASKINQFLTSKLLPDQPSPTFRSSELK